MMHLFSWFGEKYLYTTLYNWIISVYNKYYSFKVSDFLRLVELENIKNEI